MPASIPPVHPYPGNYRSMADAARDNQIITVECAYCKRVRHYLASDLIAFKIVPADWPVHKPPFQCRGSHSDNYMKVRAWSPAEEHLGRLYIRVPRVVIKWDSKLLGE